MYHLSRVALAALCLLAPAALAGGGAWTESGDAAQSLPGNLTTGTGALATITGAIGNAGQDADIYAIRITSPAAFSATTANLTTLDTQLFLFDSVGRGVTFNDDISATVTQSRITGQLVPAAGLYYLAITASNFDPRAGASALWNDTPNTGERAPDGPGAANPLTAWSGASTVTGPYSLALTGAAFQTDTTPAGCPPAFAPAVQYTGGQPSAVRLADLNRDGRPDLVVADSTNGIVVRLGNGDGSFATTPAVYPATSARPGAVSLSIADLNADGRPDVVAVSQAFVVLLGNANGTLAAGAAYFVGNTPAQAEVADFNRDGRPDLAAALLTEGTVTVALNIGEGTFPSHLSSSAGSAPYAVAAGDFNRDGRPDLAVVNPLTAGTVTILIGNGNSTFLFSPVAYPAGANSNAIVAADFNGDGRSDLALTNPAGNVFVLLANGDGSFQFPSTFPSGSAALALTAGDLNGDGRVDLAVAHSAAGNISLMLGNGNGAFQAPVNLATAVGAQSIAIADLNGDGRADLAVANLASANVSVLLQLPGPALPVTTLAPLPLIVAPGAAASLTAAASSSSGALTYQWRKNGVPLLNGGAITGAQTPALTINPAAETDTAAYDVVFTSPCGSATSAPAPLLVVAPVIPPYPCLADLGVEGGFAGHDGLLNQNDFIVYLNYFFDETGCH